MPHSSFVKTSVKQSMKHKVCSNFQMSFLHLSQMDSPVYEALGQVDIFVRSLGLADLWSGVPPSRGIWWPRVVLHQVSLTFGQPLGQVYPPVEVSSSQAWYYFWSFGSGWPVVRCTPIDDTLGQVDIFVRYLDQADLWSDVPPHTGI